MTLGDKLAKLRKDNNYTQEQLAELLGVSRQAISKWESDVAYPETDNLIKLGELYNCSIDYLIKDESEDKRGNNSFNFKNFYYERKSAKMVRGIPLWHVNIGIGRTAKGIIAIGFCAKGVISVGLFSLGLLSLGLFSLGLVSVGVFAVGLMAAGSVSAGAIATGAICFGVIAAGAIAIGDFSLGAIAVGEFSTGALAVGRYFAMGDHARAAIAIGKTEAIGKIFQANSITDANYAEILSLLKANVPKISFWMVELIKPLL